MQSQREGVRPLLLSKAWPEHNIEVHMIIMLSVDPLYRSHAYIKETNDRAIIVEPFNLNTFAQIIKANNPHYNISYNPSNGLVRLHGSGTSVEFYLDEPGCQLLVACDARLRIDILAELVQMYNELVWIASDLISFIENMKQSTPRAQLAAKHVVVEYLYKHLLPQLRSQHAYERTITHHNEQLPM